MKNFEERKAEIFRRSENRIKLRKRKQKQFLAFCIPLFLLSIFSVAFIPSLTFPTDTAENENRIDMFGNISDGFTESLDEEAPGTESPFSYTQNLISIEIKEFSQEEQQCRTITDKSAINNIFTQICTILSPYASYDEIMSGFSDGTLSDEENKTHGENTQNYVITVTSNKNTKRTFTLSDNKLFDYVLNIEIELTDNQLNDLTSALGGITNEK